MFNINISVRKNQEKKLTVVQVIEQLVNDCSQWSDSSRSKIKIFNVIARFYAWYGPKAMPSQERIAFLTGCTRVWVNKVIKEFVDNGWIKKIYRHRKTCIYRIDALILDQDVSWALKDYFPALKILHCFRLPTWLKPKTSPLFTPISYESSINTKKKKERRNFYKKGDVRMISERETQEALRKANQAAAIKILETKKLNEECRLKRDEALNEDPFVKQYLLQKQLQEQPNNPFNKYLIGALC